MMPFDPRWITGVATLIIGGFIAAIPLRLWLVHPINRVFNLGPFVTEEGFRALLRHRIMLFAIGIYIIINGISRLVYAARWVGLVPDRDADFIGGVESIFSIWAAGLALIGIKRIWLDKS